MTNYRHCFDFDVGYLVRSPCRDCEARSQFPRCHEDCEVLDRIREVLCGVVSSARGHSSLEAFSISPEIRERNK